MHYRFCCVCIFCFTLFIFFRVFFHFVTQSQIYSLPFFRLCNIFALLLFAMHRATMHKIRSRKKKKKYRMKTNCYMSQCFHHFYYYYYYNFDGLCAPVALLPLLFERFFFSFCFVFPENKITLNCLQKAFYMHKI